MFDPFVVVTIIKDECVTDILESTSDVARVALSSTGTTPFVVEVGLIDLSSDVSKESGSDVVADAAVVVTVVPDDVVDDVASGVVVVVVASDVTGSP